jgi:IMP cyclohydrolase
MKLKIDIETESRFYQTEVGAVALTGHIWTAVLGLAYRTDDFLTPGTSRVLDGNGDAIGTVTVEPEK